MFNNKNTTVHTVQYINSPVDFRWSRIEIGSNGYQKKEWEAEVEQILYNCTTPRGP